MENEQIWTRNSSDGSGTEKVLEQSTLSLDDKNNVLTLYKVFFQRRSVVLDAPNHHRESVFFPIVLPILTLNLETASFASDLVPNAGSNVGRESAKEIPIRTA